MATIGQPPPFRGDRKITIQRQSNAQDASGAQVATWCNIATNLYAEKVDQAPPRRAEFEKASRINDVGYTQFRIRYYPGLTGEERVICEGVIYQIWGRPAEQGRRQYTIILGQTGFQK